MTTEPVWLSHTLIIAIHDEQIAEHGGSSGLRDEGLLESALARPLNLAAYGTPDLPALAAAYAFGLARNHPFIDGNKRSAFVAAELFLDLNGMELAATDEESVLAMLSLAAGETTEQEFAARLRARSRPR